MAVIVDVENIEETVKRLKAGEVGIIPSDTIYGISSLVDDEAMERIYEIKERPQSKKLIVLSDKASLESLGLIVPDSIMALAISTYCHPTYKGGGNTRCEGS